MLKMKEDEKFHAISLHKPLRDLKSPEATMRSCLYKVKDLNPPLIPAMQHQAVGKWEWEKRGDTHKQLSWFIGSIGR